MSKDVDYEKWLEQMEYEARNPKPKNHDTHGGEYDEGTGKIRYSTREDAMKALASCRLAKRNGYGKRSEARVYFEDGYWYLTSSAFKRPNAVKMKYKYGGGHQVYIPKENRPNKSRKVRSKLV